VGTSPLNNEKDPHSASVIVSSSSSPILLFSSYCREVSSAHNSDTFVCKTISKRLFKTMLRQQLVISLLLMLLVTTASALALSDAKKVLVTGAGGKTGRLVMQKLLQRPAFHPIGVVRTDTSKEGLIAEGVPASQIVICDVCDAGSMEKCCEGESVDAVIICTSATPAPTGEKTPEGRPVFGFPNGFPEQVDWIGQKNQIDAAKKSGASHVVICSSMGGTDPENGLNKLAGGNILLWKRKAEKYLIDSGLTYTICHPGGLLDEAGGLRELVVGVDDEQVGTDNRSIPRGDVAEILISSLEHDSYKNRSFDARSKPEGEGTVTTDFGKLLNDLKGNCDYTLGKIPE
jgi:uncharacterized protein YbjT (DUF2867 family)